MSNHEDALEEDPEFFTSLSSKHSLLESVQVRALQEDGDMEGEAAEAIRSHHAFDDYEASPPQSPMSPVPGFTNPDGSLIPPLELDEGFMLDEEPGSRASKKLKVSAWVGLETEDDRLGELAELDPVSNSPTTTSTNGALHSEPQENHLDAENMLELELDDAFINQPETHRTSAPAVAPQAAGFHPQPFGEASHTFQLADLELDEAFQVQNDSFRPLVPPALFKTRPEEHHPGSLLSVDEMMAEAENGFEDMLETDSMFEGPSGRPTSAQRPPVPTTSSSRSNPSNDALQHNSRTGPRWITTASLVATRLNGTQIRIPRRKKIPVAASRGSSNKRSTEELQKQCLGLLDEPIHRMLNNIRQEALNKRSEPSNESRVVVQASEPLRDTLWTDRYRPAKFIDLIGDERVFRSAMGWLKAWDKCVFKRFESAKRKRLSKAQQSSNTSDQSNPFAASETDPYGRPNEKVLLLTGRPGLGKTTMAEVLADQAGYQVISINASDDRSASTVTDRIKSALESRTLDGGALVGGGLSLKNNRPCCVIIDEIDGAGGGGGGGGNDAGFVRALVKLVTEGSIVRKGAVKGKKLDQRPLLRPIICICNDLYAPVLRPLRPISRIVRFTNPTPTTIIKRLETICRSEKLSADLANLTYLVKLASGDLRSCLNTLQFIKSQTSVVSDRAVKAAAGVGMKDTGSSVQAVLSSLFKIPTKKTHNKSKKADSREQYLNELVRDINTCGQNERIVQGCFEAYPGMKPPTDLWGTYTALHDWLDLYDQLETRIWTEQAYQLLGYVPYAIAAWRELMASVSNKTPEYPKTDYEMHQRRSANEEIGASFNHSLPPGLKACFKTREVYCELMPLLMRVIGVDLRPMNAQLIKREEKEVLNRVVLIMLELGLKFAPDRGEDGQLTYVLEPQIDFSVYYDGKRPTDLPPPRFAARQMIQREIEVSSIRRHEGSGIGGGVGSGLGLGGAVSILEAYKQKPGQSLQGKTTKKVAVDFFGRLVVDETDESAAGLLNTPGERVLEETLTVLYRYHEGFSNAVKKPMLFSELLTR